MPLNEDSLSPRERGYIEGFAAALDLMRHAVTGDSGTSKSYDPMTISGDTMHSYAFDLKDGGRHHPLSDYESAAEICGLLLAEVLEDLREVGRPVHLTLPLDDSRFEPKP